jgi:S1-C subfamily serine protease
LEKNMKKSDLHNLSNSLADAVEAGSQYTVLVNARRRIPSSGIVYSSNLLIAADHAVEQEEDIGVLLPDQTELSATLVGRDPGTDLALLKVDGKLPYSGKPAGGPIRIGQLTLALGRPGGIGIQASLGIVSALGGGTWRPHGWGRGRRRRSRRSGARHTETFIRTDAVSYPGFSGGPLIDTTGEILGVNTSGLSRGVSLAVPAARAWEIASLLEMHGSVPRGYLGIRSQAVALQAAQQEQVGREQTAGLLIIWVEQGSPADQAGIIVGDILIGVEDEPVADPHTLQQLLAGDIVGQETTFQVLRGGKPADLKVTITQRTDD